ncbi:MAG: hypothetical protein NTV51_28990 [Verrucomicrobia bacterium]|nr:hypothetical protein [Verrucomicrobiota bacterium]
MTEVIKAWLIMYVGALVVLAALAWFGSLGALELLAALDRRMLANQRKRIDALVLAAPENGPGPTA